MSDELTVANEKELLATLLERASQRAMAEREIESQHATEVAAEQRQYQTVFQLLAENHDRERVERDQTYENQLASIELRCETDSRQVDAEFQRVLSDIEDRLQKETATATKERDEATWLVSSLLDDDTEGSPLQRLQQAQSAFAAAGIELKAGLESLDADYEATVKFLQRSHLWSEPAVPEPTIPTATVEAMKGASLAAISAAESPQRRIRSRILPLLFMGILPLVLFLVIVGVLFAVVRGLCDPAWLGLRLKSTDRDWALIAAGIAAAFGFLPVFFLHLVAGRRTWSDYEELLQQRVNARFAFSVWERTSKTELNMLEAECSHLQQLRVKRRESALAGAETKWLNRLDEAHRLHDSSWQRAQTTYPPRLNAIEANRIRDKNSIEQQFNAASQEMVFRRESDLRQLQAEFDARLADSRGRYQKSWIDLIHLWKSTLENLGAKSDRLVTSMNEICPAWDQIARDVAPLPDKSPAALGLGRIRADLTNLDGGLSGDPRLKPDRLRFDVPLLLPLHERPSLILHVNGAGRDAAVKVLQSTMLRFLTSLPPGKVRFTIFDPVGLGANFAAFMHLVDFDELLVSSRIWTEPTHIEKKLGEITEHMETVLQTYLRNEFATIDDYNHFAGEVAEPYRVVVIANFPANFTDIALRRLTSIMDGGRRCGVYVLLSFDKSQEVPRSLALTDLEKHATVLQWTAQGFRHADPDLAGWPLVLDAPPAAEEFGRLVRLAGQHSRDSRRVEVPFERVAPTEDEFWNSDSRTGIDIPVGRAGATKRQHLRLGKGTSQHVLIAGKTGSGKSTLLHALITNLALYYSPAEVEFYLIDFKKGVEFKVYAEERLPHARVIAIESDREFGVSVLQRLDALLRDRGELFREAGVQDIAGFRNARPETIMPRTLLLVDEFQEFFIEDDAISQQASLLFDRLIRQGRAFGVHILLGSQTLAGAYSLARSTLGQVAVRIALQCSDTDAHLILSEENTAARLLTRPGEAIYNDANGLIEGNHPFQIVWLDEDDREGYLKLIRAEADGNGTRGKGTDEIRNLAATPPLIFEGNIPADPAANRRLQRVLAKSRSQSRTIARLSQSTLDSPWTCWLGDSVSLAGPLELKFGLREGGNLLIVGRDDEAALGIMAVSALALGAQACASDQSVSTINVLDGSFPASDSARTWQQLASMPTSQTGERPGLTDTARPGIVVSSPRETAAVMQDLIAALQARSDQPGPPIFLFVFDLARFRDLRKVDDDFGYSGGFGGGTEKTTSPAQMFTELLRDGPAAGIFTFVWVDSFQTAQRWLARDQMNRFEQRVLFAMNANDSSSLVDSPLAGRLGENRALLFRGDTGTLEKFRPFSPPASQWLDQLSSPPSAALRPALSSAFEHATRESESPPVETPNDPGGELADVQDSDLPSIDEMNVQ